jgi:hypothetical protein
VKLQGSPVILDNGHVSDKFIFYTDAVVSQAKPVIQNDSLKQYFIEDNDRYYNFNLEILAKQPNSNDYEHVVINPFDNCLNYKARFPFTDNFLGEPVSGTITYEAQVSSLFNIYNNTLLKTRVTVYDRAGNLSKPVESPPFFLSDILITRRVEVQPGNQ